MDIARQLKYLYASSNVILRKFASCSISVKIQLLESYCINFYCSSLWCNFTKQSMSNSESNLITYRLILGVRNHDSASYMFVSSIIVSFEAKTRKTCNTFRQRMIASTNSVISTIHNNYWFLSHYLWQRWENLVYIYIYIYILANYVLYNTD